MNKNRPFRIYLLALGLSLLALLNGWRGWQLWLIQTELPNYQFHLTSFIILNLLWSGLFSVGAILVFLQQKKERIYLTILYLLYFIFSLFLYQRNQSPLAPYNWGGSALFYLLIISFTLWSLNKNNN